MRNSDARACEAGSYDGLLHETVTKRFGFEALHSEQETLIRASIEGKDVLGILPTGRGKSACFQIPGIVTRSKTLVISPLIALQDDQVQALRARGVKAFAMHSGLDDIKKTAAHHYFKVASPDEPSFLYTSPEMLLTETFHRRFDDVGFNRAAVDEAHCVSTWGNSFRPDYQRIRVAVQRLRIHHCSAFTATVDPRIERDIRKRLPLSADAVRVYADPLRPNLLIKIEHPELDVETSNRAVSKKTQRLLQMLAREQYQGPVIVYCGTRTGASNLYRRLHKWDNWLRPRGFSVHLFHGALPYDDKVETLQAFLNNPRPIVIATSAFGMGIDRPDVRQIVHYNTPYTLLDYAQQIGRAGRDGNDSLCTTFHSDEEFLERELKKLEFEVPTYDFVERVHARLHASVDKMSPEKRRNYNIRSFLARQKIIIDQSEGIQNKQRYLNRTMIAVALLQRVQLIREDGDGLSVFGIQAGGENYQKLVDLTHMQKRMEIREKERVAQFFGTDTPDQELLWRLLSED